MKSTEDKSIREDMVDMHAFFINRIESAIKDHRGIEATWLVYSCMENRFFRTLGKYKDRCKYCTGKSKCSRKNNELAISTKIDCIKRLVETNDQVFAGAFSIELLDEIKKWVKERNQMTHNLLSISDYIGIDENFMKLAVQGKELLNRLYSACTEFRKNFFSDSYTFVFPPKAMDECPCNPQKKSHKKGKV